MSYDTHKLSAPPEDAAFMRADEAASRIEFPGVVYDGLTEDSDGPVAEFRVRVRVSGEDFGLEDLAEALRDLAWLMDEPQRHKRRCAALERLRKCELLKCQESRDGRTGNGIGVPWSVWRDVQAVVLAAMEKQR